MHKTKQIVISTLLVLLSLQKSAGASQNSAEKRISADYDKIIQNINQSKNANEFDEQFHNLKAFLLQPGSTQSDNDALCAHLKRMPIHELQYIETILESPDTMISLRTCRQGLLLKLSLAARQKKSALLDSNLEKIRPIPFEERQIPDLKYLSNQGLNHKEVMLTFDDGPTQRATNTILMALKKAQIKAGFFSTGRQAQQNKDLVKKILAEGHVLGSHSFFHTLMMGRQVNRDAMTYDYFLSEFVGGHVGVYLAGGYIDPYFRFPNGCMNKNMRTNVTELGLKIFGWSIDSFDWQYPTSKFTDEAKRGQLILNSFIKSLKESDDRGIVLMHDVFAQSAEALPLILKYLADNKYKVVLLKPHHRNILSNEPLPLVTQSLSFMKENKIKLADLRPPTNSEGEPLSPIHFHPRFDFQDMFPQLSFNFSPKDPHTKSCE